jgi:methylamine---glutamate N-methyltransferase subunit B
MSEAIVSVGDRPIREVNKEIKAAVANGDSVVVRDTRSRHNIGIGLREGARLRVEGSAGYYCGGLNDGAFIEVERNVGWSVAEAMASGEIIVNGYAGMSVGSAMRGGLIHVKGDTGPRCGIAMKGGDIIVEGKIGYLSGFMSHAGRIIALGGAAGACADSLWGGEVWVAGPIESLGVDTKVVEPTPEEVADVEALLIGRGLGDNSRDWQKIISAQRLWHFESRDASAWLMI